MTVLLADPPAGPSATEVAPPRLFEARGGEPALDALVSRAWLRLAARGEAACPVCGGRLEAVYAVAAIPVEGRCAGCGSSLS